ncbi:hypothetical protein SAMN02745830_06028 [Streptomyces sp. Amel2xC10]|nr:hypothetical protein SAMN02745830_06028 [Streptomyces sp. Amel2xC10]
MDFVCGCDLVVCLPEAVFRSVVAGFGLAVLPVPFVLPSVPIRLSWYQRYDTDRAHTWLGGLARVALTARSTPQPNPEPADGTACDS